jgi:hypothetical protein
MGERARRLTARWEYVWMTAWMGDANEVIAPQLLLPKRPHVTFGKVDVLAPHWKLNGLTEYAVRAGTTCAVVIDDEMTDGDVVSRHLRIPTLTIAPNPEIGLTDVEVKAAHEFLEAHHG